MEKEIEKKMTKEDYRKYIMILLDMIHSEEELKWIYNCCNISLIKEPIS